MAINMETVRVTKSVTANDRNIVRITLRLIEWMTEWVVS